MVAEDRGKARERKVRLLPPPHSSEWGYVFLLSFFESRRPGRDGLEGERHTSGVGSRTPANQIVRVMEMEKDSRFRLLKEELLERAHKAGACREQYSRAYGAQTLEQLMDVVKDNFFWAVNNKVLDGEFIDKWSVEFNDSEIWHNQSVSRGYLIAYGNATVEASGNATVEASDNATVRAYGNATVEASDNATVRAYDNATVIAYDNATVIAYGNATVEASDNATVRAYGNATVRAYGNATVRAYDNATVIAYGNAYVTSWDIFECKLSGAAIWRIRKENIIRYVDNNMKFEKIPQ